MAINQVSSQPGDDRRQDNNQATHCGCPALCHVRGRPVLANKLPVLVPDQVMDQNRGEGNRKD